MNLDRLAGAERLSVDLAAVFLEAGLALLDEPLELLLLLRLLLPELLLLDEDEEEEAERERLLAITCHYIINAHHLHPNKRQT